MYRVCTHCSLEKPSYEHRTSGPRLLHTKMHVVQSSLCTSGLQTPRPATSWHSSLARRGCTHYAHESLATRKLPATRTAPNLHNPGGAGRVQNPATQHIPQLKLAQVQLFRSKAWNVPREFLNRQSKESTCTCIQQEVTRQAGRARGSSPWTLIRSFLAMLLLVRKVDTFLR